MTNCGVLGKDEVLEMISSLVLEKGSQAEAAKHLGISGAYLGDILKNNREPGAKVLDALGLERITVFKRTVSKGPS